MLAWVETTPDKHRALTLGQGEIVTSWKYHVQNAHPMSDYETQSVRSRENDRSGQSVTAYVEEWLCHDTRNAVRHSASD